MTLIYSSMILCLDTEYSIFYINCLTEDFVYHESRHWFLHHSKVYAQWKHEWKNASRKSVVHLLTSIKVIDYTQSLRFILVYEKRPKEKIWIKCQRWILCQISKNIDFICLSFQVLLFDQHINTFLQKQYMGVLLEKILSPYFDLGNLWSKSWTQLLDDFLHE